MFSTNHKHNNSPHAQVQPAYSAAMCSVLTPSYLLPSFYHPLPLSPPSPPPWVHPASVILSIPTFPPPHFSRPEMAVPLCFASLAADFNSFRPEHTPSNDDHDAELLTFCLIAFFVLTTQAFG